MRYKIFIYCVSNKKEEVYYITITLHGMHVIYGVECHQNPIESPYTFPYKSTILTCVDPFQMLDRLLSLINEDMYYILRKKRLKKCLKPSSILFNYPTSN